MDQLETAPQPVTLPDELPPQAQQDEASLIPTHDLRDVPSYLLESPHTESGLIPTQDLRKAPATMIEPEVRSSRFRHIAHSLGARAATEVAGLGVDAALIGGGDVVRALQNVGTREAFASAGDVAILNRLSPQEVHKEQVAHPLAKRIGHLTASAVVAIAAQKYGPGVLEHVSHSIPGYASMLSSKVAATAGVNAAAKRFI